MSDVIMYGDRSSGRVGSAEYATICHNFAVHQGAPLPASPAQQITEDGIFTAISYPLPSLPFTTDLFFSGSRVRNCLCFFFQ